MDIKKDIQKRGACQFVSFQIRGKRTNIIWNPRRDDGTTGVACSCPFIDPATSMGSSSAHFEWAKQLLLKLYTPSNHLGSEKPPVCKGKWPPTGHSPLLCFQGVYGMLTSFMQKICEPEQQFPLDSLEWANAPGSSKQHTYIHNIIIYYLSRSALSSHV